MQKIVHPSDFKYEHPVFSEIEQFFNWTSVKKPERGIIPKLWDSSFMMLIELFREFGGFDGDCRLTDKHYTPIELPDYDEDNIILCFSGGKDSCAAIKFYLEYGYNIYLYHMPKVNPSQNKEEMEQAKEIAKYFNLPIYVEDIKVSGKHEWIEHPMKNMIIASCALQYGMRNNITTKIAFGNYTTSSINDNNFVFCGGDDIEMWIAYASIIQRIIPDFKISLCLKNTLQSMDSVCCDRELLDMTVGCLGRASLRKRNKEWVEQTFGVKLPTHRCGQCYKCAHEYLYMVEKGWQDFSKEYYLYCLKRLKANLDKERYTKDTTFEEVCDRIMLDKNSKYLKEALANS